MSDDARKLAHELLERWRRPCLHPDHNTDCDDLTAAIEARDSDTRRAALEAAAKVVRREANVNWEGSAERALIITAGIIEDLASSPRTAPAFGVGVDPGTDPPTVVAFPVAPPGEAPARRCDVYPDTACLSPTRCAFLGACCAGDAAPPKGEALTVDPGFIEELQAAEAKHKARVERQAREYHDEGEAPKVKCPTCGGGRDRSGKPWDCTTCHGTGDAP